MEHRRETVLITGASAGIGRAAARQFARAGFRVFGTSRREQPDENGIEMLQLDVTDSDSVRQCVGTVEDRAGRVDVLVNNAGVWQVSLAEETPIETVRAIFETNFFGVVRMTNAVLPDMRRRRAGRIIHLGSLAAWVGEPGEAFYAASKRAVAAYSEALRQELWLLGIRVSLVEPGAFRTELSASVTEPGKTIADYDVVRAAVGQTLREALGHGGDPQRVGRLLVKVARTEVPGGRYGVGEGAASLPYLKALLPQRMFESLVRRGFGLARPRRP